MKGKRNYSQGGYVLPPLAMYTAFAVVFLIVVYSFSGEIIKKSGLNIIAENIRESISGYNSGNLYSVYFNNQDIGDNDDCGEVYPVPRSVHNEGKEAELLTELLKGPTPEETDQGFTSFFSEATAFALQSVSVNNGVAAVSFADIRGAIPGANSSCVRGALMSSIESTMRQFGHIKKIIFAFDGNPKRFYEWVRVGCNEKNNNCDASIFR